jgi:hypothetical protein
MLKSIKMTLDPSSIDEAIKEIELFESKLKPAMQGLIDHLAEKGVEVARASLLFLGGDDSPVDEGGDPIENPAYDTGALLESIRFETSEGMGKVIAGEGLHNAMGDPESPSYAMYVEYGNGYTKPDGWWYPAPWGWRTYNGKLYAWTKGMAPRPFMGNTLNDLEQEARAHGAQIIAEYIRGERA